MGSQCHLLVTGDEPLLDQANRWLDDLESAWSRFLPDSDVSRLNAADGRPTGVRPETVDVLTLAIEAWAATGGRFDPTTLPALVAAGYDRSFEHAGDFEAGAAGFEPRPAPGCVAIEIDREQCTVRLPAGIKLDLGGIGKGRAADLIADRLIAAGTRGACVNLGGDARLAGTPADGGPWTVGVEHPVTGQLVATLALGDGAVATSTVTHRRWGDDGAHHLIDPTTGRPSTTDLLGVTVVAGTAAWAEVYAKTALLAGSAGAADVVTRAGLTGMTVDRDGVVWTLPGLEVFVP
jgi:thiamine biosynthesis lipoprotein